MLRHDEFCQFLNQQLERLYPSVTADQSNPLAEPLNYAILAGGKRIRPYLTYLCHSLFKTDQDYLPAASAIEMVHTYSLIHDDLPCMDDDALRRGKPTLHVAFDEATAVLSGDALLTDAFTVITSASPDPKTVVAMVKSLSLASGSSGMVKGQALDMQNEGEQGPAPDLKEIHRLKTAQLMACACELGALSGGATHLAADLNRFGKHIGLAFQIIDDLLDDKPNTGKTPGKDGERAKATYLRDMSPSAAKNLANEYHQSALDLLTKVSEAADRNPEFVQPEQRQLALKQLQQLVDSLLHRHR